LVSKSASLDELSQGLTWATLEGHAHDIIDQYANADIATELWWCQDHAAEATPAAGQARDGDMVFENAILFLCDALLSREFTNAVKGGDSGCIVLVLKIWALSFRGSGQTKYAHEMLHLIHNLTCVWPKPIW